MDAQEASRLIGVVYDSALEKYQWQSLTRRLRELCPGHVVAVVTFDDAKWVSSHVPTLPESEQGEQIGVLMEEVEAGSVEQPNDLNEALFRRQPLALGTLYSTRRLFSDREFRNFEGYKRTMKPIGAGHWTGAHFSITGERRAAILVVENDHDSTEKDNARVEELITLIAPHMIRAARFSRALTSAREAAETYAGFVDAIALPLVVVTQDAHVQLANTMGQRLLDAGEIVAVSGEGRLRLSDSRGTRSLYAAIANAERDRGPHAFQFNDGGANLAACVCPYSPTLSLVSDVDRRLLEGGRLFALLVGARPTGEIHPRLLRDAFGLTIRESEVCRGLLSGLKPAQLASDMQRSEKTIRNQIQSVHDKVGVKSTRELTDALSVFRSVGAMYQEREAPASATHGDTASQR